MTELIAIHNFAGDQPGDLPFAKGDRLVGTELTGQWWTGVDSNDRTGTFPSNYVKVVSAKGTEVPNPVNNAGFAPPPPAPVHHHSSGGGAPTANYGVMPTESSGSAKSAYKTRCGTVATIRGAQFLTSLFALAFMGSTTAGKQYMCDTVVPGFDVCVTKASAQAMAAPAASSLTPSMRAEQQKQIDSIPTNDGVKFVLAMSILGWLESTVMLMIACAAIYNAGVRAKIDAIVMKHRIVFCVDCFLAWLSLMALTICPVEKLTIDRRAGAAAIFLMMYMWFLGYSILMSYKDIVREKLLEEGWRPGAASASSDPFSPPNPLGGNSQGPSAIVVDGSAD